MTMNNMQIRVGQLDNPQVIALLSEHHQDMLSHSPIESVHALDISALKAADVTFWSLWCADQLVGIGALKQLNKHHGEIKSMRTSAQFLRQGVAHKILAHLIAEARVRGYQRLSLETGSMDAFKPAQKLYQQFGFQACSPFGDYKLDPYSSFLDLAL